VQYMGGKAKIARRLVAAILDDTANRLNWFEPFVGGGNVLEQAAPHFTRSVAMDAHEDLILMWSAVNGGWGPPEFVSKDLYAELRHAAPSALRGYAGFAASFGGKWFGGYAAGHVRPGERQTIAAGSRRVVLRQSSVIRANSVVFRHGPFGSLTPPAGTVVYCDPPYAGTTRYNGMAPFDHALFYKTLGIWADSGRDVYVSEYAIPDEVPHLILWSGEQRNGSLKKTANSRVTVEKLFKITGTEG